MVLASLLECHQGQGFLPDVVKACTERKFASVETKQKFGVEQGQQSLVSDSSALRQRAILHLHGWDDGWQSPLMS